MDSSPHAIFDEAVRARQLLERAWSKETAYQGITLMSDDPVSRGQCGVSSMWLARQLLSIGYDARFAEGTLYTGDAVEECVWVHVNQLEGSAQVVDITSDQFQTVHGSRVHVGEYDSGPGAIGSYVLQADFHPYKIPRKKLLHRYDILQGNLRQLRLSCSGLKRYLGFGPISTQKTWVWPS